MRRGIVAAAVAAAFGMLAFASTAQADYQWADGTFQTSEITNCASIIFGDPYTEIGADTYVGQYVDPNNLPKKGQTFYVHTVAVATGNACAGQYVHFALILPSGVTTAVTPSTPIQCWALNFTVNPPTATQDKPWQAPNSTTDGDCPPAPESGDPNGPSFDAYNNAGSEADPWPLPQGYGWEIQVPVTSSRKLVGIGSPNCQDCLQGLTWLFDGNSSPKLFPSEGLFVQDSTGTGSAGGPGGSGGTGSGITPNPPATKPSTAAPPPTALSTTAKKCKKGQKLKKGKCVKKKRKK